MLKADFHIHTREDPYDKYLISYTAKDLIRFAAKKGFEVLSITNHESVYFNKVIYDYAKKKGILLIPGAGAKIEGKHVLLINITNDDLKKIKIFEDLKKLKDSALIIAPHPFFIKKSCLGIKLEKYIDYFDAVEYSHYYMKMFQNSLLRFFDRNIPAKK
ncbi:MAG: hypothetical protein KKA43_00330, partial [Nanoarchaeota archaeon]|nr:hypothetical protein [Nanoarchaeota archaeon]